MLHRLQVSGDVFTFWGGSFINERTLLMFLSVELLCAIYIGCVRLQIGATCSLLPGNSFLNSTWGGSMKSEQETDEDQEGIRLP